MSAFQVFLSSSSRNYSSIATTVFPVLVSRVLLVLASPDADEPYPVEEVIERVADDEEDTNTNHHKGCPWENNLFEIC